MARIAAAILFALALAGCAGERFSFGVSAPAPEAPNASMTGRWILSAPNAPVCGMNFTGAPDARTGNIAPEGGCPGNFYLSRHWALDRNALIIKDDNDQPLAQLNYSAGHFDGQATTGIPVTLSR